MPYVIYTYIVSRIVFFQSEYIRFWGDIEKTFKQNSQELVTFSLKMSSLVRVKSIIKVFFLLNFDIGSYKSRKLMLNYEKLLAKASRSHATEIL